MAEAVEVRIPGDDDATAVGLMHLRSWHETYPSTEHDVDAAWIDEHVGFMASPAADGFRRGIFRAQRTDPSRTYYRVARTGADVVGFVHATRPGPGDSDDTRLEALYLLSGYQGSGLADRMVAGALAWTDGRAVVLEAASYQARAIAFYRRHGFRATGETGSFRERVPTVVMRRPATGA